MSVASRMQQMRWLNAEWERLYPHPPTRRAQKPRIPLPAPPGQPWPKKYQQYADDALNRQERYGK